MGDNHPELKLGATTVAAVNSVRLLGVDIESGLSLDQHASIVWEHFFYRLRQLRADTSHATVLRRRINSDTRSCLHHLQNRLLQLCSCRCSEGSYWQATASAQCCCAHHQRHRQIRSCVPSAAPWEAPLARHRWSSNVQTAGRGILMSECSCTSVLRRSLCPTRYLRSAERKLLHLSRHRLDTYGHWAFAITGLSACGAWNSQTDRIRKVYW